MENLNNKIYIPKQPCSKEGYSELIKFLNDNGWVYDEIGDGKYTFNYDCTAPDDLNELEAIVDDCVDNIGFERFKNYVPFNEIQSVLSMYHSEKEIANDCGLKFFVGQTKVFDLLDETEYRMVNFAVIRRNGIEYVWKK